MYGSGKGAVGWSRAGRMAAAAGLALAFVAGTVAESYAQNCKPRRPRPPIILTTMGPCQFDPETLSFTGTPAEQAMCLLRAFDASRNIGPHLESLPDGIASRAGRTSGLPEREALAALLVERGLVWDYAPYLWTPLARARDNQSDAPQTRYFVIHDTSGPFFGSRPFPSDIDQNRKINNLARFRCADGWEVAHVIINRTGDMLLGHELGEPWRATKFERATRFGTDLRGLFLHVELIQPRRRAPGRRGNNDALAPDPGFSAAQYDRLALVYIIASVRSGRWLIPAFHGPIDSGIRGGHDDPQNFELETFAASLDRLMGRLMQAPAAIASITYEGATAETPEPIAAADASAETPAPIAHSAATAEAPAVEETKIQRANAVPTKTVRPKRPAKKVYRSVRPKPKSRAVRVARRRS